MSADLSKVDLLTRREIEARIAGPLIKAYMEEFGEERALKVAEKVIRSLARESGAQLASLVGGDTLEHFRKATEAFSEGGAHDMEVVKQDEKEFAMNITRCKYVDMYKETGMPELGFLLSCNRDYALAEGFNPRMKLTRTKTIMEGDDVCDFCFKIEE
jgi:predicted hydrocarbon binding protein